MGQEFAGGTNGISGIRRKISAAARLKTRLKRGGSNRKMPDWRHGNGACVMDSRFLMASMGSAVGEKITRAVVKELKRKGFQSIIFACSRRQNAGGHPFL